MQPTFTQRRLTEYQDLINEYLEKIPIDSAQEFAYVQVALAHMVNDERPANAMATSALKTRIESIQNILDNPDMYVADHKDYLEFTRVIKDYVLQRVGKWQSFTPSETEDYLSAKKAETLRAQGLQKTLREHPAPKPGDAGYIVRIPEERFLAQRYGYDVGGATGPTRVSIYPDIFSPSNRQSTLSRVRNNGRVLAPRIGRVVNHRRFLAPGIGQFHTVDGVSNGTTRYS